MEKEIQEWQKLHQTYLYSGSYETKELAQFVGVSPRTVQRWLKGSYKPSSDQAARIRQFLVEKTH